MCVHVEWYSREGAEDIRDFVRCGLEMVPVLCRNKVGMGPSDTKHSIT